MADRTEKVYVLYGSQTGNSEERAKELCSQVATQLSPKAIQKMTGTSDLITVEPVHMQLDDFLEIEKCAWTRLVVIVTSSYGVGQAPLGCYRFRDLCDAWCDSYRGQSNVKVLDGISFALCGLGDSKYTTYFQNPAKIDEAMQLVGAKRVGPLGKADASGTGNNEQLKVVEQWIASIWPHLAAAVVAAPLSEERLKESQMTTVELCRKINPEFEFDDGSSKRLAIPPALILAILVAFAAVALFYIYHHN